jgi:formylmethanofuran dehydrogenase subunit E-like metal-binding protein
MRKPIRSSLVPALGLVFLCCAAAVAAPLETAVSTAMQSLSLKKGDSRLLLMTDAPYVRVDGRNALPYLATAQDLTGCSVGRGNLLFFQRPQSHPLRFMLFHKTSGEAVIISPGEKGWSAQNLNLGPATITQPVFWARTGDYQAGRDLFTLAAIANVWAKDGPYDFLKSAELHNHICPGLTSDYLIAHYIQKHYPLAPGERYTVLASPVWCKEDALQVVLDCTPGKKTLIVKPLSEGQLKAVSVPNPAALLLVWNDKQKTGRGVALSFDFDRMRALAPEGTPKAAGVLAALDHLNQPERFVSAAATFDLDESRYQRLIEAGSNPYEVAGLVK